MSVIADRQSTAKQILNASECDDQFKPPDRWRIEEIPRHYIINGDSKYSQVEQAGELAYAPVDF